MHSGASPCLCMRTRASGLACSCMHTQILFCVPVRTCVCARLSFRKEGDAECLAGIQRRGTHSTQPGLKTSCLMRQRQLCIMTPYSCTAIGHSYRQADIGHRPQEIGHRQSAIRYRPSAIGYRPSAIGHRSSDIGHQPSDVGHW